MSDSLSRQPRATTAICNMCTATMYKSNATYCKSFLSFVQASVLLFPCPAFCYLGSSRSSLSTADCHFHIGQAGAKQAGVLGLQTSMMLDREPMHCSSAKANA